MSIEEEIKKAEEIWRQYWTTPSSQAIEKYYQGFGYTRNHMFTQELDELEDIYADGLEELEAELDYGLPQLLQSMECFLMLHKKKAVVKQKLLNMEHKRGVMDVNTNT